MGNESKQGKHQGDYPASHYCSKPLGIKYISYDIDLTENEIQILQVLITDELY